MKLYQMQKQNMNSTLGRKLITLRRAYLFGIYFSKEMFNFISIKHNMNIYYNRNMKKQRATTLLTIAM